MKQHSAVDSLSIDVKNIGGISNKSAVLRPGVTVLKGENASNRSSFLQAVAAAFGSRNVYIKSDKSEGSVTLSINGETYTRTLVDEGGQTVASGDTFLSAQERELAERFGFLSERNQARTAIRNNDDLYSVVMDPVDVEQIESEISKLQAEREDVTTRINQLEEKQERKSSLQSERADLDERITSLQAEIKKKEDEVETLDVDDTDKNADNDQLDKKLESLRERQSELERMERRIESTEATIESLQTKHAETESALADVPDIDTARLSGIESEITGLRDKVANREAMMAELQNVIQFNEQMLEEAEATGSTLLTQESSSKSIGNSTDQLLSDDDTLTCWTCGSKTSESDITGVLERLQSVHEDLHGERRHLQSEIDSLETERSELEQAKEKKEALESELKSTEAEIEQQQNQLSRLEEKYDETSQELSELKIEVESLREEQESATLDVYEEISKLEFKLEQAQSEREDVVSTLSKIESERSELESLRERSEQLSEDIDSLRQHVQNIEQQTVDQFNKHMAAVLTELSYENITRIWLERKEVSETQGRKTVQQSTFDLHVVRESDEGANYEDSINTLSESEREVTGLVFALAGYLAHDVHDYLPVMFLDSLEAIDSTRIASLVSYLRDYADYLIVALLPEDATALPDEYEYMTSI